MEDHAFNKLFSVRSTVCFFLLTVLFFFSILRVAGIAISDYGAVQKQQSSYRLTVTRLRGTVYDRNGVPLTNSGRKVLAAVSPTPRAVTAISSVLSGEEKERVLESLQNGKPVLCTLSEWIDCEGIVCFLVPEHQNAGMAALHLIGTLDESGHGASGLEKAYDDLLYTEDTVSVVYTTDGKGGILTGIEPEVEYDNAILRSGVVTTLDSEIQRIAEKAAEAIEVGAVLVADAKTSEILAMVSRPVFDPDDLSPSLDHPDSPFLNRAIAAYQAGSVFKPLVAAAGIESGYGDFTYLCTGSCRIVDRDFRCHKRDGHGAVDLESGLANSCNTFFYNFASLVGAKKILSAASALTFSQSVPLCRGIGTAAGSLPTEETLANAAQLANFSIGQGELSVSPAAMLNLYAAIGSDGGYYLPSVVKGTKENGVFTKAEHSKKTRVMSEATARTLRQYLQSVITEGTGASAQPKTVTAAGKTATAQTGRYQGGVEICAGWFCGFFPAEEPAYTVIVFSENTARQTKTCAEIFAQIADRVTALSP